MAEQELKHTQGGVTTRDDATDVGVPMLAGGPNEPVGPEDALGEGPKRGDYTDRIGPSNYHPHEVVRNEDGKLEAVAQRPRAEQRGATKDTKGGVDSADA